MSYQPLPEALAEHKPASPHTITHQQLIREALDFSDRRSFANAQKGFIASIEPLTIPHDRVKNRNAFDLSETSFLNGECAETVNPSLWRQAQLNAQHHGLFEVVKGIYQIRSFDLANMTLIAGDTGWIIVDPLTSTETSRAGLELANLHLGERPVVAVIHTHSHADHFAGVLGVIKQEDAESGAVQVIAPPNYVDEVLSENILAGNVMNRRATYMYGNLLKSSPTGFVTNGLGAALAMGSTGFVIPNDTIEKTGDKRVVDGIEIEFQLTMGTEAPSEMVFYFPQHRALCMSEITSHHLHNLYTPRGAQVRDALAWADQINESIDLFGNRLEVQFASHHWPIWGNSQARDYLKKQRDTYKFIHDQTLRLANHGFNKEEIAEKIQLPSSLGMEFYNRDYYGTVNHNSRAVFVRYLGYFDGNPSNWFPLPQKEKAQKTIDYMGGADAVIAKATDCFKQGEYRWVAEILNLVVLIDPELEVARALLADTLEQLGYQSESAAWRNIYLCGALELRMGLARGSSFQATESMAQAMPLKNMFQSLAVRLNGSKAEGLIIEINVELNDTDSYLIAIENSVLHGFISKASPSADVSIQLNELDFKRLMLGLVSREELSQQDQINYVGDVSVLDSLLELFDTFQRRFPLVAERPDSSAC
jgi:alkyl sulfatase BDS1-like metallo-beta-lactamase superfamily hydrolase